MVSKIDGNSPNTTPATAATTTAKPAAAKKKRRGLEDIAAERRAPSAHGKVPAATQVAGAGATVRAAGKAIASIDAFKESLKNGGVVDGQSLAAYNESRQEHFDKRKEDIKASFTTMQAAIASGDEVRQAVADNLQELVDLMPADMVKGANVHKSKKEDEAKDGVVTKFVNWVKRKPAPAHIDELELDKLLLKQLDIVEAAITTLEDRIKAFNGVGENLSASRVEFSQQLEESVMRFNGAVDVLHELQEDIKAIEEEQATLDPMHVDYGKNEQTLITLKDRSREITKYAAFLNDWIGNLRDFEVMGVQLQALLDNAEGNAARVLANGVKLRELQGVTTGVVAAVAAMINAADWTMLVLDTTTQNLTRAIEHVSGRVSAFGDNMNEWQARTHDATMQMAGAMYAANLKSEEDTKAFMEQLLADRAAGKRAVFTPTTAKLSGPITQNPMRARGSEMSNFVLGLQAKQAGKAGLPTSR